VNIKLNIAILILLCLGSEVAYGQKEKKISFVGGARSVMNNNQLTVTDSLIDSTTAKRNTGGYALVDLGVNIKPNKNTEILGMFRIRNGYGGFWGSGVTFDVRQLYIKGIVANAIRYQVGDLNLKQTPFTLYNHHADAIDSLPAIFALQNNIIAYEKFYRNNTWRMQGANVDFGLQFNKLAKELNVTGFVTRLGATNFANVAERLMAGAVVELVQSDKLKISYNVNGAFDVLGTIRDSNVWHNTVQTFDATYKTKLKQKEIMLNAEVGKSSYGYSLDTLAPKLNDYFIHAKATVNFEPQHLAASLGYLNVGPQFRSIGAQSKDVNYNALPQFFDRYTNTQSFRPLGLMDVVANDNIYSRTISSRPMVQNNLFNNAMPFGIATENRNGVYAKVNYKKDIDATLTYYNLSEIQGQGTLALRKFNIVKLNANVPLHTYFHSNKKLELQVGTQQQSIKRTSNAEVENVNFVSSNVTCGLRYEIFKDFDLLGGYMLQNTAGDDFIAERDNYNSIIYFYQQKYDVQQNLKAVGLRYNFTPKIFLSTHYQQAQFTDGNKQFANYSINQFSIIYNMLF
jgi:hypothetical protein